VTDEKERMMPTTLTRAQNRALAALARMPADRRLYVPDVARLTGLRETTITRYHFDAAHRRAAGQSRGDRDLPPPDAFDPGTKTLPGARHTGGPPRAWWHPGTLVPWIKARHAPGHARNDGRSPAPPGSRLGRPPLTPGPKRKRPDTDLITTSTT
jgi:hypothetical protein